MKPEPILRLATLLALVSTLFVACGSPEEQRTPGQSPALTSQAVEQTLAGTNPPPAIAASFDGLGAGFVGPQGASAECNRGQPGAGARTRTPGQLCNPSDNSLAVGPDHIVQTVNSRMAIFTKKGARFDTTGQVLYGPVETLNVFKDFGGACEEINNGDAVVRYDQLAGRWLIVMPIFRRLPFGDIRPAVPRAGEPARESLRERDGQPGAAMPLCIPTPEDMAAETQRPRMPAPEEGAFAMCYALSAGPDPMGSYYRYAFVRPLFPDYPRPATRHASAPFACGAVVRTGINGWNRIVAAVAVVPFDRAGCRPALMKGCPFGA